MRYIHNTIGYKIIRYKKIVLLRIIYLNLARNIGSIPVVFNEMIFKDIPFSNIIRFQSKMARK